MHRKHFPQPPLGLALGLLVLMGISASAMAKSGYLGVQTQKLNEALMEAFDLDEGTGGVLVNEVVDDSPADNAGFKRGDLITSVDGEALRTPDELRRRIRDFDAGDKIKVELVRRGKKMSIDVELGEMDRDMASGNRFFWREGDDSQFGEDFDLDDMPGHARMLFLGENARPMLGVTLHELDEQLGDYFKSKSGMLVLSVREDSPAAKAGIENGDVIVGAAGEDVAEIDDLHGVLEQHEAGDTIELSLIRKGKSKSVQVELGEPEHMARVFDDLGPLHERFPGGMHNFELRGPNRLHRRGAPRIERFRLRDSDDELDELRQELKALREELEELKDN